MRITHYTIRDIKALDGVPAAAPEWDVVAKVTNGTCFYSDQTFDDLQEANAFITKQMVEPEPFEYWEGQPLEQLHLSRIPHDAWIMNVPVGYTPEQRATIARTGKAPSARPSEEEKAEIARPNPPVSNYDDEAEPSGEKAGRLAYVSNLARIEAMRPSLYHSDCQIAVIGSWTGNKQVTLWKIRGVPKTFYPTKIAAEVAARAHFPHDNPTVRYSRISFVEIDFEYEEDPC
jgi:hypothetical protein